MLIYEVGRGGSYMSFKSLFYLAHRLRWYPQIGGLGCQSHIFMCPIEVVTSINLRLTSHVSLIVLFLMHFDTK